ncbi:MAG: Na/Pi cotransporter family protein [Actinomycetota bacterium]
MPISGQSFASIGVQTAEVEFAPLLVGFLGGLALLLFGLGHLTSALKGVAGDSLRALLARLTGNRFKAVSTGLVTTAVLQSSTVTTVLVVGFVDAGLLNLTSALGVILGSNVGTTVTAQVVAIDVADWALALVAVGFAAARYAKSERFTGWGNAVLGLGLVFVGIQAMGSATSPLSGHPPFLEVLAGLRNPVIGAAAGAVLAALLHSSSATTVLAIVFASEGLLPLEAGLAVVIGANVGTCVTAGLVAVGKSRDAQRAAAGHIAFNLAGAVLWLSLISPLATIAAAASPQHPELEGTARLSAEVPRQLANAHFVFNVSNVVLLIGLLRPASTLLRRILPDRTDVPPPVSTPRYLNFDLLATPSLALVAVQHEMRRLGELVIDMLEKAPHAVLSGNRSSLEELEKDDENVDALYSSMVAYLARLTETSLSGSDGQRLLTLLEATNALESIADLVETNLVAQGRRRLDSGGQVSEVTRGLLTDLFASVNSTVADALKAAVDDDAGARARVQAAKGDINRRLDAARGHQVRRLIEQHGNRRLLYAIETDVIDVIKRIEYLARHVVRPRPATGVRIGQDRFGAVEEEP